MTKPQATRRGDRWGAYTNGGGFSAYLAGQQRQAFTKKAQPTAYGVDTMDYSAKKQIDESKHETKAGPAAVLPEGSDVTPQELYIGSDGMAREEQRLVGKLQTLPKQSRPPAKKSPPSANYNPRPI